MCVCVCSEWKRYLKAFLFKFGVIYSFFSSCKGELGGREGAFGASFLERCSAVFIAMCDERGKGRNLGGFRCISEGAYDTGELISSWPNDCLV